MLRVADIFIAAVPFLFGAIRAIGTGMTDVRYLVMAVVSHIATMTVLVVGHAGQKRRSGVVALAALAFLASTLLAFAAGWMVGARHSIVVRSGSYVALDTSEALCEARGYKPVVTQAPTRADYYGTVIRP